MKSISACLASGKEATGKRKKSAKLNDKRKEATLLRQDAIDPTVRLTPIQLPEASRDIPQSQAVVESIK